MATLNGVIGGEVEERGPGSVGTGRRDNPNGFCETSAVMKKLWVITLAAAVFSLAIVPGVVLARGSDQTALQEIL